MRHLESGLQTSCVTWFRWQYPKLTKMLIAVPNGGFRNAGEAKRLKGEGVTPGVSDLLLLISKKGFNCLGIEMKVSQNGQTKLQKEWQKDFEKNGSKYVICRSLDSFMKIINEYLNDANSN